MKVGKAIERIEGYVEVWDLEQADEEIKMIIFKDDIKAFKIAIKALERQVPKLVDTIPGDYTPDYNCTVCGETTRFEHQKYCVECGQRLEW